MPITAHTKKSTPRKTRARRGEGGRLRDEIIEATSQLLFETGSVDAITIRMIADRVGVTPPSIYLHFEKKAEVIYTCCETLFEQLAEFIDRAVEDVDEPSGRLAAMAKAYVRFGLQNPESYRVLFMTVPSEQPKSYDVQDMLQKSGFMELVDTVADLMASGRMPRDDPFKVSLGAWAVVHGLTSLMISHPEVPWPEVDEMIDHQIDTYLQGLVQED
jgi:AcrR family transcriptional regulator